MEDQRSKHQAFTVIAHIAAWTVFLVAPMLMSPGPDLLSFFSEENNVESLLLRNLMLMALFYFNLFYLAPKFLPKHGAALYFTLLFILIFAVSSVNFFIHDMLVEHAGREFQRNPGPPSNGFNPGGFNRPPRGPRFMLAGPFFSSFLITTVVAGASTLIILWRNWLKAKQDEQERSFQKVNAELSMLRLQISPHFLFNTLNNIRWLVRTKSDQAEPAVIKLSQLLRYVLYQANEESVPLSKEIEHLRDYITLQQMRIEKSDSIKFSVEGHVEGKAITPLLLIPVIENFFKHGNFEKNGNEIVLKIESDRLTLNTENWILQKSEEPDQSGSGIGMENVRRRMALHYPEKHLFNAYAKEGKYFVQLELILES